MDLFEYFRCNSLFIKLSQKLHLISSLGGFPNGAVVKNPPANAGDVGLIPRLGRFPWRGKWQPTPMLLPGKLHGQRSLVSYSPLGRKELDTTKRVHFHFWLQLRKKRWEVASPLLLILHAQINYSAISHKELPDKWFQEWSEFSGLKIPTLLIYLFLHTFR